MSSTTSRPTRTTGWAPTWGQFIARDKTHIVAITGSYFRGDAEAVLAPTDEARFDTVTYTYDEQLNGYQHLKHLDIGYFFYSGPYADDVLQVLDPAEKTILHIPNVNSRESTKDKMREVEHTIEALGEWQGVDEATGFQLVKRPDGQVLRIADLVDEVVATYRLAGINRTRMEKLFHRLFEPAKLDVTINNRFGHPVQPREWFLVPLFVIEEAVARIRDGSITRFAYDPQAAALVEVGSAAGDGRSQSTG